MSLKSIKRVISDITVDQALILQIISEKDMMQSEIANLIFKDYASMTRIISLMIKKDYVIKTPNDNDRRSSILTITKKGEITLKKLIPIINQNRKTTLNGITLNELNSLKITLNKMVENCKNQIAQ